MGDLLTTGSVLAAFLAGGVALFAPCCIVFLAPSYLAVAVKNRRWRLLPLTFVFAAGLALVLVPITLGISLVASAIANYHQPLYYAGGALMLALAALSLSGRMMTLPRFLRAPDTTSGDALSFFGLGVFSGVASSCCAPVLAGVMTLSALSGSVAGGLALGLAYTFGMVFPLFVMALAWDRFRLGDRRFMTAKPVTLRAAGHTLHTNTINVGVATAFAVMGGFVLYLAGTGTMTSGPGFQVGMGEALANLFSRIETWVAPVPEPVLGLAVLTLAAIFVTATLRDRHRTPPRAPPTLARAPPSNRTTWMRTAPPATRRAVPRQVPKATKTTAERTRRTMSTKAAREHRQARLAEVAHTADRGHRGRLAAAWAGVLVVVLAVVGFMLATSQPESSAAVKAAPDFTLTDTTGRQVSLSEYRGRNVVLYFNEGAGCQSCLVQMAEIEKETAALKDLDVTVLPIVMNTREQITADIQANEVATPFLLDDGTVSQAYGTLGKGMHAGLPGHSFILIDSTGEQRWYGEYPSMWLAPDQLITELRTRLAI